jgi:hypothetical protein
MARKHEREAEKRMAQHRDRKAEVAADMARLQGTSEARLERDDLRGASSPLGMRKIKERGR